MRSAGILNSTLTMLFIIVEYYFLPGSFIAFIYSSLPNNHQHHPNLAVEGQALLCGFIR